MIVLMQVPAKLQSERVKADSTQHSAESSTVIPSYYHEGKYSFCGWTFSLTLFYCNLQQLAGLMPLKTTLVFRVLQGSEHNPDPLLHR